MSFGASLKSGGLAAWLSLVFGFGLLIIGLRFAVVPDSAAETFGVDIRQPRYALHAAIALRDLWLAAIMIALVLCKEWRPLALVFGLGTFVCLGDAVIAARSSGTFASVLFHLFAGGLCAGLAGMLWRLSKRSNGEAGHVRP